MPILLPLISYLFSKELSFYIKERDNANAPATDQLFSQKKRERDNPLELHRSSLKKNFLIYIETSSRCFNSVGYNWGFVQKISKNISAILAKFLLCH